MKDDALKHFFYIREALSAVKGFVSNKSFKDYSRDELLRSAVERKLEIVGEALNRLRRNHASIYQPDTPSPRCHFL